MNAETYFLPLRKAFESHADDGYSMLMCNYLKGQFPFYGLASPLRRDLQKKFYKDYGYPPANLLPDCVYFAWQADQREWQYAGMELAVHFTRKHDENMLQLAEFMITHKSWWDTVDLIATKIAGAVLFAHPELIPVYPDRWIANENIWLKRSALLFQLKYKKASDKDLLFNYIRKCATMREFFIRKAIGWSLREYSKTAPESVRNFVESHALLPLSRKEALKTISRKGV
ncbi:MAG: DNA alkylation repair protein [Bacteroidales bacterium]